MSTCPPHRWLLSQPVGVTVRGMCLACRLVRDFDSFAVVKKPTPFTPAELRAIRTAKEDQNDREQRAGESTRDYTRRD